MQYSTLCQTDGRTNRQFSYLNRRFRRHKIHRNRNVDVQVERPLHPTTDIRVPLHIHMLLTAPRIVSKYNSS